MVADPQLADYEAFLAHCAENDRPMHAKMLKALHVIDTIVTLLGNNALAVSFNGGKDACAAMHILRFSLMRRASNPEVEVLSTVKILYFDTTDEFQEVKDHIADMTTKYELNYVRYQGCYQDGLRDLVEHHDVKAIVMGVRTGDPHTEDAEHITPSTAGWPAFLRVYPILSWDYGSVWKFLRSCSIPYCCLYDHGYTSIGKIHNTIPNEALRRASNSSIHPIYRPAYELEDYTLERANRMVQSPTQLPESSSSQQQQQQQRQPSKGYVRIAVVVIGDEILNGQVHDQNLAYLCEQLDQLGAEVIEACVLPDSRDAIALHISRLSSDCDYVITTGGIGPTHDDVTFEGIAQAFHVDLEENQAMKELLEDRYDGHPRYDMFAHLPSNADVLKIEGVRYPIIRVRNVFCLPGIPELMKEQFQALRERFIGAPLFRRDVQLVCDEADIAETLKEAQQKFISVKIGSYPLDLPPSSHGESTAQKRVRVVIQGRSVSAVEAVTRELEMLLKNSSYA